MEQDQQRRPSLFRPWRFRPTPGIICLWLTGARVVANLGGRDSPLCRPFGLRRIGGPPQESEVAKRTEIEASEP